MRDARANPAHEIEKQIAEWSELVFDVVPENPEKPHVADDVEKSAMQKHAGEQRQERLQRGVAVSFESQLNVRRSEGVGLDESLTGRWRQGDLMNEHDDVHGDQQQRHDGE